MRPRRVPFLLLFLLPVSSQKGQRRNGKETFQNAPQALSCGYHAMVQTQPCLQRSYSLAIITHTLKNVPTESEMHVGLLVWEPREAAVRRMRFPNRNGLKDGEHRHLLRILVYPSCAWDISMDSPENLMPSTVIIILSSYIWFIILWNHGSRVLMLLSMYLHNGSSLHI